jgi:hypothetical protein
MSNLSTTRTIALVICFVLFVSFISGQEDDIGDQDRAKQLVIAEAKRTLKMMEASRIADPNKVFDIGLKGVIDDATKYAREKKDQRLLATLALPSGVKFADDVGSTTDDSYDDGISCKSVCKTIKVGGKKGPMRCITVCEPMTKKENASFGEERYG